MNAQLDMSIERSSRFPKVVSAIVLLSMVIVIYVLSHESNDPKVVLGRMWPAMELISIDEIDHRGWDRLLQRFVDDEGGVDYSSWYESPTDVQSLDDYLSVLSRAEPNRQASREARLAFWINAYNALTIRGILRDYPAAVHDRGGRRGRFDLWNDLLLRVGGTAYSLGEIEHELLRPMREPRIHFAIVCGSRGCPRLLNRAYRTGELEQQLRENSRQFFADPQKLKYDPSTGQLRLSPILKWYAKDFGDSEGDILETIAPYLPDGVARRGRGAAGFLDYDRSLNEQAISPPVPPSAATTATDNSAEDPD